jgi:ERCC4-type nuclease
MELIVDDRDKLIKVKVERITVGDYAFVYKGKVIVIVERKSLTDLASSIKDGRMDNNNKLLEAQKSHGCQILYIIEGTAYPCMEKCIGRMPYKCLQGKLDSLLFRNDIKIIWTKNCEHTAKRLAGLSVTFTKMANDGVFGEFKEADGGNIKNNTDHVIKPKHTVNLDQVHIKMLTKFSGVSYKVAMALLQKYTVKQLLTGQTDNDICYNITYIDSGFRMGPRGIKLHNMFVSLPNDIFMQQKILVCINGISIYTAERILSFVSFSDIVLSKFKNGDIAGIQQTEKRKIGNAIEAKIRLTFSPVQTLIEEFHEIPDIIESLKE